MIPQFSARGRAFALLCASAIFGSLASAQSLGNAGTVVGTITDPSGAFVPRASISIQGKVTGYQQKVESDSKGGYRAANVPAGVYHMEISATGFAVSTRDVEVRNSIPIEVNVKLELAGAASSVTVEAAGADILETDPSAHVDVDRSLMLKLPSSDPGGGLSQAIINSSGGVAADGNGFFHPLGDHAQVSFVIDGQPISDQQSKVFSTQFPASAVQSMELTTGTPNAEFGDKTSLVVQATTRSGLGASKPTGNVSATAGSFGTGGGGFGLGWGTAKFGNFIAADGERSGRFLDTPEFARMHDVGNTETIFDRLDYQPTGKDALHLNLFTARNWIQIPNSYDELSQDQHQRVLTWSIAPGYQRTVSAHTLVTINPYVRKDEFAYYASRNPFADFQATQAQQRQLMNWGVRADVSTSIGHHTLKYGLDLKQTRLLENFQFGITDPFFNDPCLNPDGTPAPAFRLTSPGQCAAAGFLPNSPDDPEGLAAPFSPSLLPFDLTRGGRLFGFHAAANVNQYAGYVQDSMVFGKLQINLGLRLDRYDGLSSKSAPEPRAGVAYNIKATGTVLRVSYARTMETPFNENLLLSNATGLGGLAQNVFGSVSQPIFPGSRNQYNTGLQQALGKWLLLDLDYYWKFTHNAFDFNTLLNTTITFPIAWHSSKLDGATGRVSTTNIKGFQAFWNFGHTRARFFPPEEGGLISQGAPLVGGVFRIDHDQAFQSTVNARYQRPKNAEWISLTMRYDSGAVISGVPDAGAALGLTPNQQVTIGLTCNGVAATVAAPLRTCGTPGHQGVVGSSLVNLPQGGYGPFPSEENDDHNPARVKPRNTLDLAFGTDNLLHREGPHKYTASVEIANLTNVVALYNFLSTFSGTHFLAPRSVVAKFGMTF